MNPIEFYSSLEKYPLSKFGRHFKQFRSTAFRLELMPTFNVPQEKDAFELFLSNETEPPAGFNNEWHDILLSADSEGKSLSRVRVVDGEPTTYLKFEILWAYKKNLELGEDIRFIIRSEPALFVTPVPILKDFWLFDEKDCFLMEYDYCGTFLGVTKVPDSIVNMYIKLMNEAKDKAIDFDAGIGSLGME